MQVPPSLIQSLISTAGFNKEAFEKVHSSGEQITSIRINSSKISTHLADKPISSLTSIPWADYGFYLTERPSFTFDPLFHAGTYYVQEASSMFLEQALKQTTNLSQPIKVLDLCAAPGGKSTHIQSLISKDSLLVSNDVIRSRANILKENIIKWGCENVVITNNDPKDFAILENYFDIIVVDAPCSGSGLFRRDQEAINEWSENNVQLCSQRQQRILADVLPALKNGGVLIYSTCSYSKEEDEDIMDWLDREFKMENLKVAIKKEWGIIETATSTGNTGYRFWPDKVKGEGFFLSCFRKVNGENADTPSFKTKKHPDALSKNEVLLAAEWFDAPGSRLIKHNRTVYAWPSMLFQDFTYLLYHLKLIYSGTLIGELMKNKLVPDHALAMSGTVFANGERVSLDMEQSIRYLQRKDISIPGSLPGWKLVCYQHKILGWVNVLANRVNNYYPKEWRILKEIR